MLHCHAEPHLPSMIGRGEYHLYPINHSRSERGLIRQSINCKKKFSTRRVTIRGYVESARNNFTAFLSPPRIVWCVPLTNHRTHVFFYITSQIARFIWLIWGPYGTCRPRIGPMLVPWILLSGILEDGFTKAPFVDFSVFSILQKYLLDFIKSHSHLTYAVTDKLRWHLLKWT